MRGWPSRRHQALGFMHMDCALISRVSPILFNNPPEACWFRTVGSDEMSPVVKVPMIVTSELLIAYHRPLHSPPPYPHHINENVFSMVVSE